MTTELTGFPAHLLTRGTRLFRIHRRDREPWFFAGDLGASAGRWNLAAPRGTVYFSDTEHGAWLEVFPGVTVIDRADIDRRGLLTAVRRASRPVRLADLRAPGARRFGVTLDLSVGADHRDQQRWARALAAARFRGVRGPARHDPTAGSNTVALFGRAGANPPKTAWLSVLTALDAGERLLDVLHDFGIRVIPAPHRVQADD